MKKRTLFISLLLGMTLGLAGCGQKEEVMEQAIPETVEEVEEPEVIFEEPVSETEEEVVEEPTAEEEPEGVPDSSPEGLYKTVLDDYYSMFETASYEEYAEDWDTGIEEVCMYSSPEEVLDLIGYYFIDLNGDGTEELLIGSVTSEEEQVYNDRFLVLYAIVDGEPKALLSGWGRSSQYLMQDNTLANCASGSASSFAYAVRYLDENNEIQTKDFYFTDYDSMEEVLDVYYNTTSVWDKSEAEKLDMSSDELYSLSDRELQGAVYDIPYVPFRNYGNATAGDSSNDTFGCKIMAAEGKLTQYSDYKEISIGNGNGETKALIVPNGEMKNVKALSLTYEDAKDDGTLIFSADEAGFVDKVTKDCPLVLNLVFVGDIPNNGISFEDENGEVKTFAIAESGRDGSLFLQEIVIK